MQKNPVICIVIATMLEAKPFVTEMPLEKIEKKPFNAYHQNNIFLIISGIGKANAAMATFYGCHTYSPDIIVNVGAAGAAGDAFPLGEFYHICEITEYDRPDFRKGAPFFYKPLQMKGFKTARVATQDQPVLHPEKRKEISRIADLVEMEAASVMQAANKFSTPCVFFKYVTDTAEHTEDKDIVKYIKAYRDPFYLFFTGSVLPRINSKLQTKSS